MFNFLMDALRSNFATLYAQHADLFLTLGLNLFRGFATILIVWVGVKSALNAASGGPGFDFSKFAEFLLVITFGYAMLRYYATPLPGIGVSFYHLITDQAFILADRIGTQGANDLALKLENIMQGISAWGLLINGFLLPFLLFIIGTLAILEMVVFAVIAFGYIAVGVLVLVGPIFIPFLIVPRLDFLFWGWLKAFFQYAFYPVIANAFIYVMAKILLELLNPFTAASFTDFATALGKLPLLIVVIGVGIYGTLKIPTLVNHLFSGSSGEGGGGLIQTAASVAIRSML
jgi:type IV secretory pathway VirB6-like protein